MKEDKLVDYFDNDRNVEVTDGVELLVRFYPQDLVRGHRECFRDLLGVYSSGNPSQGPDKTNPLDALGRLLARVALDPRTTHTFPGLLANLKFYSGAKTKSELKTIGEIREAGLAELSRRSSISRDDLFSDAAYGAQYRIASEKQEEKVIHAIEDTFVHPLITAVYCPPDQPFQPVVELPGYLPV